MILYERLIYYQNSDKGEGKYGKLYLKRKGLSPAFSRRVATSHLENKIKIQLLICSTHISSAQ